MDEADKHDAYKLRLDLLPPDALWEVSRVLTHGAVKYGARNWEGGSRWGRYLGACLRHLMQWMMGEDVDEETGISHLAHATCNLMFLLSYSIRDIGRDDRPVVDLSEYVDA